MLMPQRFRSILPNRKRPVDPGFAVLAPAGNAMNHGISHSSDVNPSRKNAFFQPKLYTIAAIIGAPNARPARVPQFTTPDARPRSFAGNRTLTNFIPPGR